MPNESFNGAVVDLRSDTVTRPTPAMRRAMAEAEVGDDVYGEDPTINRLQDRAAELLGFEAGLFVPTGSMGNLLAIKTWARPGMEVICDQRAHIYHYEMAAISAIAGCLPTTANGPDGILSWDLIEPLIRPRIYYRAQTGLIELESSHNMHGGTVYPPDVIDDICEHAHAVGIPVHLDGARIFNAATALGCSVADIARNVDSVMFCFSKALGAPVGSMLVGSAELMERGRIYRKALGGGMRLAGVLAAAGLIALEQMPARLHEDHANARFLAEALSHLDDVILDPQTVETNILIFKLAGGLRAQDVVDRLKARGVLAGSVGPDSIRLVTHYDVSRNACIAAADILAAEIEAATPVRK
jgi:threonine aldolase